MFSQRGSICVIYKNLMAGSVRRRIDSALNSGNHK
jgi:hypothetical protein